MFAGHSVPTRGRLGTERKVVALILDVEFGLALPRFVGLRVAGTSVGGRGVLRLVLGLARFVDTRRGRSRAAGRGLCRGRRRHVWECWGLEIKSSN